MRRTQTLILSGLPGLEKSFSKRIETFRDCHYAAGFILVDRDDDPCLGGVLGLFDTSIQSVVRSADKKSRFLHVCIAVKEVESWYLADADAVNAVISGCAWQSPEDTYVVAKGHLRSLVKHHLGKNASFNEIAFAKMIAPKFQPNRARPHSSSFRYFWELVESRACG